MANQKLLEVFLDTKRILCASDYYIHIPKKIIHVTNSENTIPHLMGMQYIGRPDMFTGDRGAYMIKKKRLKYDSLEKLVQKYYRGKSKQDSMLAMVNGKIDNLYRIEEMLSTYSELYLYDVAANPESELKTDYLLVNQLDDRVLQLGMVKADKKKMQELWDEAKKKCRLGEEEIRMAKETGLNPKSLIKNIPNKKEIWKTPVKDWIHDMYEKRQKKVARILTHLSQWFRCYFLP